MVCSQDFDHFGIFPHAKCLFQMVCVAVDVVCSCSKYADTPARYWQTTTTNMLWTKRCLNNFKAHTCEQHIHPAPASRECGAVFGLRLLACHHKIEISHRMHLARSFPHTTISCHSTTDQTRSPRNNFSCTLRLVVAISVCVILHSVSAWTPSVSERYRSLYICTWDAYMRRVFSVSKLCWMVANVSPLYVRMANMYSQPVCVHTQTDIKQCSIMRGHCSLSFSL